MTTFARIRREHDLMLRLTAVLAREAAAFGRGDRGELTLMLDVLQYLTEHPDHYHHALEDVALWHLADRGLLERPVAEALAFEQRALRYRGAGLLQQLQAALADVPQARQTMVTAAEQYAATLQQHVDHEERVLLPLLQVHLVSEDWKRLTHAAAPGTRRRDAVRIQHRARRLLDSIAERAACGCRTAAADDQRRQSHSRPELVS